VCPRLASSAIAQTGQSSGRSSADGPGVNVARLLLLDFGGELPKQTGREPPHVDGLTRFEFELLRLLVARAVDCHHDGELVLQITDTGVGSTDVALRSGRERGVGLRNIEKRLACHYGPHASLTVRTAPGQGTAVEIRLPVPSRVSTEERTTAAGG
jgi:hypothetical protein